MAQFRKYDRVFMNRRDLRRYCHDLAQMFRRLDHDLYEGKHYGSAHLAEAQANYAMQLFRMCCGGRLSYLKLSVAMWLIGLPPLTRD